MPDAEINFASSGSDITKAITTWGAKNYCGFPWRNTDSPWLGLLAEVLLQRTRATHVEQAWEEIVKRFPTPESVLEANESDLAILTTGFGLDRRHRTILELAYFLDGRDWYPIEYDDLIALYGIGHYTASAYLSLYMNVRAVLLDANVARWLSRLVGKEKPKDVRRCSWLWELAESLTPACQVRNYNYAVLDFTMVVCTSRQPDCDHCPVRECCKFQLST